MTIFRTCNLCSIRMTGGIEGFIEHGKEHHPGHHLIGIAENGKTQGRTIAFVKSEYWCPLDNKWYASRKYLARTIKKYGMTNQEYLFKHTEHMPKEWEELTHDPKYGDARSKPECLNCGEHTEFNQMKWSFPIFCGFSCSTTWHAENTDRVKQAEATKTKNAEENPDFQLRPNQTRYWTNRGHSLQEAKELVSHRQKASTLERMIEKYGEEEGAERYNIGLTNRKDAISKSGMFKGHSKVSTDFFDELAKRVNIPLLYGKNEESVYAATAKKYIWVDCLHRPSKTVVEFYGTFRHASPRKYQANDIVFKSRHITAKQIWEKDEIRIQNLINNGYKVLILWEDEVTDNSEWAMTKAVSFFS